MFKFIHTRVRHCSVPRRIASSQNRRDTDLWFYYRGCSARDQQWNEEASSSPEEGNTKEKSERSRFIHKILLRWVDSRPCQCAFLSVINFCVQPIHKIFRHRLLSVAVVVHLLFSNYAVGFTDISLSLFCRVPKQSLSGGSVKPITSFKTWRICYELDG